MDAHAYRDLRLLIDISSSEAVTQRGLAKKYGLALGLTNFLVRRLVKKGYVKIINLDRKRLRYLITPEGLTAKARLSYEYLEYSLHLYHSIRTFVARVLSVIVQSGRKDAVLVGTGEVAEIAFLIMRQHGINVVAVLDESLDGPAAFMDQPVKPLHELPTLSYDWVVIASFKPTARNTIQQMEQWRIPSDRVITIPEQDYTSVPPAEPFASALTDSDALIEIGPR